MGDLLRATPEAGVMPRGSLGGAGVRRHGIGRARRFSGRRTGRALRALGRNGTGWYFPRMRLPCGERARIFFRRLDGRVAERIQENAMSETEPSAASGPAILAAELSAALKDLHRALIRSGSSGVPALQNPSTMLFGLIGDPRFAWMGPLWRLIARIDQQVADEEIAGPEALAALHGEVAGLTGEGKDADAAFRMRHVM